MDMDTNKNSGNRCWITVVKKRKIFKTYISTGEYRTFIDTFVELAKNSDSNYVCIANVHMLIEAYLNSDFCQIVNQAAIATPDGMPLAKSMKLLYGIEQDRVAGMDIMPSLMEVSEQKNLSIFLYGSTNEILTAIKIKAKREFPNLKLHTYSPPFRNLSPKEEEEISIMINKQKSDFVFVSLGCPKQEKWMARNHGKINSCMIGLGGAFEVYAEVKNRAPQWMQDYAIEWLYRLIQDPKRLWKRYLFTNTFFIMLIVVQIIKTRLKLIKV